MRRIFLAAQTPTAAILAGFLLSSCTAATFTKPGGTEAEFKKDSYECERDAAQSGMGTGLGSVNMRTECMEARGYVEVP